MTRIHPSLADPFDIAPRFEGVGKAAFWPDTYFTELPSFADDGRSLEEAFAGGDAEKLLLIAAGLHEQVHWLQMVGTTFGRMLAELRLASSDLAEAVLTTATTEELGALAKARQEGRAPAARDGRYALLHDLPYSVTLRSLFDHWWASVVVERMLVDDRTSLAGPIDPSFLVGLGLRYARSRGVVRSVFNAPDDGFMESTRNLLRLEAIDAHGLTVRHIEEGAAFVAQHAAHRQMMSRIPANKLVRFEEQIAAWNAIRLNDPAHRLYTDAFNIYLAARPGLSDQEAMAEFLLVCDIALNPDIQDDDIQIPTVFGDFHPVARFTKLVQAIKRRGRRVLARKTNINPAWWSKRRAELVGLSGLSDGHLSSSFVRPSRDLDPFVQPTSVCGAFLAKSAASVIEARELALGAVVAPFGADEGSITLLEDGFAHGLGTAFVPPLLLQEGQGFSPKLDEREYTEIMLMQSFRRSVHGWLASSSPLSFAGLPSDEEGRAAQRAAEDRLERSWDLRA